MGRLPYEIDSPENSLPSIWSEEAANDVEEGGLARSIRSDETEDLCFPDRASKTCQGLYAVEALGEVFNLE